MSAARDALAEHVNEQLAPLGPVTVRRMFGGNGVFIDGLMFAIIASDMLFLKVDNTNRSDFEAEDRQPISYSKSSGQTVTMSYWQAPDRLLDDDDEMIGWCNKAIAVARRAAAPKPRAERNAKAATTSKSKTRR